MIKAKTTSDTALTMNKDHLQKSSNTKYPQIMCLLITITLGTLLLGNAFLSHTHDLKKAQEISFLKSYPHLAMRHLFLSSIIRNTPSTSETNSNNNEQNYNNVAQLNPINNFQKFKSQINYAKESSTKTGEMIQAALHMTQAIERLKNGEWSSFLTSSTSGNTGKLVNLIFGNSNGKNIDSNGNSGGSTIGNLVSGLGGLFNLEEKKKEITMEELKSHSMFNNFNLADEVEAANNKHRAVDEKITIGQTIVKKIDNYTNLIEEISKGKYSGLLSSVLGTNGAQGGENGGIFGGFFDNFFGGGKKPEEEKDQGKEKEKGKEKSKGLFSGWFLYSLGQIELETTSNPQLLKRLKNMEEHKAGIEKGNISLINFMRKLEKGTKLENKETVAKLYKHMAGSSFSTDIDIEDVGTFLQNLKKIAKETKNGSINEFLGTFDVMCESIYYQN